MTTPSDRATLPLLELVTRQSLEEDYAHVAEQKARAAAQARAAGGDGGAGGTGTPAPAGRRLGRATVVVVGVFGLLAATAAVQSSRDAATDETSRTTLEGRATEGRERLAALQDRIAELRDANGAATVALEGLEARERAATGRVEALRLVTGYGEVVGPGVRAVVDDAPEDPSGDGSGRVQDEDLARLVAGLWEAGAEAVAINGQRLTPLSSIRNSGSAVNVNSRPLTAPYVVDAIGDPRTLQADLADTRPGREFDVIATSVGLVVQLDNVGELRLPAGPAPVLRHAEEMTAAAPDQPTAPQQSTQQSTQPSTTGDRP
ncbi:DUF881 domain-containing protein [Nocardioides sp. ChNu-153]|uniref:DUF881 domain-containing protein n=1 Tax=unclassified Nocardioides TaxID=2615069 RepID=UPI002406F2DD|nr:MULTISPECIES: DUF881 domain-containing protein [unclassified Nocardioides]MDF9715293.1 DUF881 domain-containing protein [Nocardioides sp. ChNu-99]MDN7122496.1 DUF881 domain-containing protein [Nocardioides sp. ChNu-153]